MSHRFYYLFTVICLVTVVDLRAQSSMHLTDIRAASSALQDARGDISRLQVDMLSGATQEAQFIEASRTDLLYALDDVIRSLAILDDGLIVDSDANRRSRDARRAQDSMNRLVREINALEGGLREIAQTNEQRAPAQYLIERVEDVHLLMPRLLVALEGFGR